MYTHAKLYTNCYVLAELVGKLEDVSCFCWSLLSLGFQQPRSPALLTVPELTDSFPAHHTFSLQLNPTCQAQEAEEAATGCMIQNVGVLPSCCSNHTLHNVLGPSAGACCLYLLPGKMSVCPGAGVSTSCNEIAGNISFHSPFSSIHTGIEIFL